MEDKIASFTQVMFPLYLNILLFTTDSSGGIYFPLFLLDHFLKCTISTAGSLDNADFTGVEVQSSVAVTHSTAS